MDDLLNPHQRRALTVALAHLERAVRTADDVLTGPADERLNPVRLEIDEARRREIALRLAEIRGALASAALRFEIEPLPRDGARIAAAAMLSAWEGLEDVHARKLARYGAVDPALAPELDPVVDHLITLSLDIVGLLREPDRPVP